MNNNLQFFDEDGNLISSEEAYRRFHIMSERQAGHEIQSMGREAFEEMSNFSDNFCVVHQEHVETVLQSVMVSAAVGDIGGIINTVLSSMVIGAMTYRGYVARLNLSLVDSIDSEINNEAEKIREAIRKEYGTDEEAD